MRAECNTSIKTHLRGPSRRDHFKVTALDPPLTASGDAEMPNMESDVVGQQKPVMEAPMERPSLDIAAPDKPEAPIPGMQSPSIIGYAPIVWRRNGSGGSPGKDPK